RRSTMTTSTSARASSAASILPVGPPPTITTACSVIATHPPDTSTTTQAFRSSHFRRFWPQPVIMRHDRGLAASPPLRYKLKWREADYVRRLIDRVEPLLSGAAQAFRDIGRVPVRPIVIAMSE